MKLSKIDFVAKAAIGTALFWLVVILLFSCNTAAKKAQKALTDPKAYELVKGEVLRLNPCIPSSPQLIPGETVIVEKPVEDSTTKKLLDSVLSKINNDTTLSNQLRDSIALYRGYWLKELAKVCKPKVIEKTRVDTLPVPDLRNEQELKLQVEKEKASHKITSDELNKVKLTNKNYLIACIILGVLLSVSVYFNFRR